MLASPLAASFADGPLWLALAALLALSGTFSASETALFSLDAPMLLRTTPKVRRLLEHPRDLLISILLGNLIVNLLFFLLMARALRGFPDAPLLVRWLLPLMAILVAGEILPKTMAMRAALPVARVVATPLGVLVAITGPARSVIRFLVEFAFQILGISRADERRITPEMLGDVLEKSADQGLIQVDEADLLAEIVELEGIRVREIMTPRVDMVAIDLQNPDRDAAVKRALERLNTHVCVVDGSPDVVVGQIRVRDLLVEPDLDLRARSEPVMFVPEVANARKLLQSLRAEHAELAVVVDEWGGTAGLVTLEDVFEEIVGDLRVEGEPRSKPVVPLGEGVYRVDGSLSVRDWNEQFGFAFVPNEYETVGGFVTARLGRIPRAGDEVRLGDLMLEVQHVRGRRVEKVDMWVEKPTDGTPSEEGQA